MQLMPAHEPEVLREEQVYGELLAFDGRTIVELGCGTAQHTRAIANGGHDRRVIAYEVDATQLARHRRDASLSAVEFRAGGAEAIDCADASVDIVLMFKSLHHVPLPALDTALAEIHRILRPGGLAYFSEPLFAGPYNDILRLFHDEQDVRAAAFAALERAVARGTYTLAAERFFLAPVHFADFAEFDRRVIHATHTAHALDAATYARVRAAFVAHATPGGVDFLQPMRVDLLARV